MLNFRRPFIFLALAMIFMSISCDQVDQPSEVTLTGKLINWGNASKILNSASLESDFGLGNDVIFETNNQNEFSISFQLKEPTYYSLGRNKLYLSPGDELYMEVDYRDPEAAVFTGTNEGLQTYLSGVAFPKSGSYLRGGSQLKSENISETIELAQEKTNERRELLESLDDAPDEFLKLEQMRLKLDQLNTILSMPIYGSFKDYWEYSEEKKIEVLTEASDVLNEISQGLMKDEFMQHPNFRDMLLDLINPQMRQAGIFSNLHMTPFTAEYDEMGAFVTQLELNGLSKEMQLKASEFLAADHSEAYKEMVQQKLQEYEALQPGSSAFDVLLTDALGGKKSLSEFSGKLMYIDLWATWCGPCIAELPAFEELKKEYKDEAIEFIPISIDTDLEAWQRYLEKHELPKDHEYVINRLDLSDYKVITIPRYFLLDADFQIIDVFATVPSDPKTKELIDQHLSSTE